MKSTEHRDACFRSRPFDSRLEDPKVSSVDLAVPQIGVSLRYPGKICGVDFFCLYCYFIVKLGHAAAFRKTPLLIQNHRIFYFYTEMKKERLKGKG